jgi:hypothetical protein
MAALEQERYPVGRFQRNAEPLDAAARRALIDSIAEAPWIFRALIEPLSEAQADTPYRDGGWTIRQVVHHVPDSHMNAYIRIRLALTEDTPTIKPYEEARWAELADSRLPMAVSLTLLDSLHARWTTVLRAMTDADFRRAYVHPEMGRMALDEVLALYEWHGRHHAAHIRAGVERATPRTA